MSPQKCSRGKFKIVQSFTFLLVVYLVTARLPQPLTFDVDDDDEMTYTTPMFDGTYSFTRANKTKTDKQNGPYRFLHIENNRIHLKGILGLTGASRLVRGGIEKEMEIIFQNMQNLLAGYDDSSLEKVIWIKFLLVNMSDSSVVENIFHKYFKPPYPQKYVEPIDKLKFGAKVEVELFASLNYTKKMDVELY